MKFVMVKAEVAAALALSESEFDARRQRLDAHGFPRPIAGLEERWSIMDVINWVNREQSRETQRQDVGHTLIPAVRH